MNREMNNQNNYGEELRERRLKLGFSQTFVANSIGVSQGTISSIEHWKLPSYHGRRCSNFYDAAERHRAKELVLKHEDVLKDPDVLAVTHRHQASVMAEMHALVARLHHEHGGELGPAA